MDGRDPALLPRRGDPVFRKPDFPSFTRVAPDSSARREHWQPRSAVFRSSFRGHQARDLTPSEHLETSFCAIRAHLSPGGREDRTRSMTPHGIAAGQP
jgi:hypothetical protein